GGRLPLIVNRTDLGDQHICRLLTRIASAGAGTPGNEYGVTWAKGHGSSLINRFWLACCVGPAPQDREASSRLQLHPTRLNIFQHGSWPALGGLSRSGVIRDTSERDKNRRWRQFLDCNSRQWLPSNSLSPKF